MALNQTGLLIIRAWVEDGSAEPLRARIRLTTNVGSGFTSELTLSNVTAISGTVEAWLHDVLLNGGATE